MTTIAFDGKNVVADGLACRGDTKLEWPVQKLVIVGDTLFGACGHRAYLRSFIDWWTPDGSNPDGFPKFGDGAKDTTFIVWFAGQCFSYHADGPFFDECRPPMAWGSGRDFALAAMACGKSAREAVEIAMRFDPWTGGELQEVHLVTAIGWPYET